jgi:DNA replication protein DnaC
MQIPKNVISAIAEPKPRTAAERNEAHDRRLKMRNAMTAHFLKMGYTATTISDVLAEHATAIKLDKWRFDKPQKGLALMGNVGTGKTTAMTIMAGLFDWRVFRIYEMAGHYADMGDAWLNMIIRDYWEKKTIVLDDLGSEADVKHYGVTLPVSDIICVRYDHWKRNGVRTYFTGNLTEQDRVNRYGKRADDRMFEMCEIIPCVGPSFRRVANKTT